LEWMHANLLLRHGMDHLDVSQIRSRDRDVTQVLARALFDLGAAGVAYGSNLDDLPCYALFEDRARLIPDGEPEILNPAHSEFMRICLEFGLASPT
jgi:RES domain